ncbi:MAG TPA: aquaporin [Gemmatimonadaceae bacterium]|nr:aquaporin [Gemmatimonadaceae bacterium]
MADRTTFALRRYVAEALGTFALVAIGASVVLVWLLGPVGGYGATVPGLSLARSFVVEAGYSGLLGFVIMAVATDERSPTAVAPFAIGATVFAGALVTGPLTGGSFNPARSLGPAVVGGVWTAHWLYWLAPVVGMAASMNLYEVLRPARVPVSPGGLVMGTEGPISVHPAHAVRGH